MTKGKVITGIAVGAVIALFIIPKTRKLITDAVAGLSDSLKNLAGAELQEAGEKLAAAH